jgi:transposase
MPRFIGIDLHQTRFTVCFRGEDGSEQLRTYRLDRIEKFLEQLQRDDEVAVEATGNSAYFHDQVVSRVAKVRLVNPMQFKVISVSAKKTDKRDAALLAQYLSQGLLPEVRPSTPQRDQIKSLLATREQLVKTRTALKNKVHGVLAAHGLKRAGQNVDSEQGQERLLSLATDEAIRFELEILIEEIRHLSQAIAKVNKQLSNPQYKLPGHEQLKSIPGIGDLGATTLLCAIGSIEDFEDSKHLASYLGIVPSVHCSDRTAHYGPITKRGNRAARHILVQCAWTAIRYHAGLRAFFLRIQIRRGNGKAIIATARKLLGLVHYTLTNHIVWEDCQAGLIAA